MNIDEFYLNIKPSKNFEATCEIKNYDEMPNSWYLIVCDLVSSADENTALGVAPLFVSAVLNESGIRNSIAFAIDRTTAIMLVPPTIITNVRAVLHSTSEHLRSNFGLKTNINVIVYTDLKALKGKILVGRYAVNESYNQALFIGGGIEKFKEICKSENKYKVESSFLKIATDFNGFEHRLQVLSPLSNLMKITVTSLEAANSLDIFKTINELIKNDDILDAISVEISFDDELERELELKNIRGLQKISTLAKIKFENLRIKNSILKKGFSYQDYKEDIKKHIVSKAINDSFIFFATQQTVENSNILLKLRALFKDGLIKFEVVPVAALHIQGIVFENEVKAYFLESIRR